MNYYQELTKAMSALSVRERTVFVGQSVVYGGQAMFGTLKDVSMHQRIEAPVAEEMQMGLCTGLAMAGYLPICIFPRIDFMLLCMNQLVNHLDKMQPMPRVIIRTAIGATHPMNPGPQHTQDHIYAFNEMCKHIAIRELHNADEIVGAYEWAAGREGSTILIERVSKYG